MSTGMCTRCGRTGSIEYGADGLPYCSSCAFYGMMKQCWRCQMYLPVAELQQYKGQWVCPYCIVDMRSEERKREEYKPPPKPEKPRTSELRYSETCERCGKEAELLYVYNNRKLCASCLGEEQKKWGLVGGGPTASQYRITAKKGKGLLQKITDWILGLVGIKRMEEKSRIVALKKGEKQEAAGKKQRIPGLFTKKPLSEKIEDEETEKQEKRSKKTGKEKKTRDKAEIEMEKEEFGKHKKE